VDEKITIRIKGGKVTIATSGFAGAACQKATEGLTRMLGTPARDTPTAEMYAPVLSLDPTVEQ
jgi:hypothetical protein